MAYFEPPKGLKGVQIDFNRFQFSWDSAGNDQRAHFLWIYKEDEMNMPQMIKYSQCMDNRVQVTFQYSSVPLQEIRKIRFLAFLSDEQRLPSRNDLYHMVQKPEFLCEVCCGTGEILWQWKQEAQGSCRKVFYILNILTEIRYSSSIYREKFSVGQTIMKKSAFRL